MKRHLLIFLILLAAGYARAQKHVSDLVVSPLYNGGTIKWYDAATGGNLILGTAVLTTGIYYASQTVNGVESTARLAVTATVTATPAAPTAAAHVSTQTQIDWKWSAVAGATGYKWSATNDYNTASDLGNVLIKAESGLTCGTSYTRYLWAYNTTVCGSTVTTLTQSTTSCVSAPAITTAAVSSIGSTTATFNGEITAINGANATTRGFKYSTSNGFDPATTGTNISETGTYTAGVFSLSPSGLTSTTTYYVVAYATNSAGTTYGSQVSFTTIVYSVWTFTNASATGNTGPTQAQVNSAYSGTSLQGGVAINTQGIQEWTVAVTGTYRIDAFGAKGGNTYQVFRTGGNGANIKGDFSFTSGEIIKIVVGQIAASFAGIDQFQGGGGGGGSFVWKSAGNTLLIAAGGGGGAGSNQGIASYDGASGVTTNSGSASNGQFVSPGGTSGNGGGENTVDGGHGHGGSAGGGWLSDGASTLSFGEGGYSILYGNGIGGRNGSILSQNYGSDGGFGGGGGAVIGGGGGGGYSGGGAGNQPNSVGWVENGGGGGGSYNVGSNPSNTAGSNSGNGQVIITKL